MPKTHWGLVGNMGMCYGGYVGIRFPYSLHTASKKIRANKLVLTVCGDLPDPQHISKFLEARDLDGYSSNSRPSRAASNLTIPCYPKPGSPSLRALFRTTTNSIGIIVTFTWALLKKELC